MAQQFGIDKPDIQTLPQIRDRISFLYIEHCLVNRQDSAITVTDARGTVFVPTAALSVLMMGPGTNVTHRAMELIGDAGASVIWVGEHGVRYYAHGRPLTHSSRLLLLQAEAVSNVRKRIAVARMMYQMRFPDEDVSGLTMQQLRGREGSRIRAAYRKASTRTGVPWSGREYDPDDFAGGDPVNKALSAAHACLYGVCHSVIVAMGCSPGLGFIHTGHERSFVYDIADLYKAEITIPIAFDMAALGPQDIGSTTRRHVRDAIADGHILEQATLDIRKLLMMNADEEISDVDHEINVIHLWDEKNGFVRSGVSYGTDFSRFEFADEEGYGTILEDIE